MALGGVLLLAALTLFCYNQIEDRMAGTEADAVIEQLITMIPDSNEERPFFDPYETTDAEVPTAEVEMPVAEVDNTEYIGVLTLPTLAMELPIASKWDYKTLKSVPCRYAGTTETNDLVLCAHNYKRHFGPIERLRPGDIVYFTDVEGYTTEYAVTVIEECQPDDVEDMIASDFSLTLFTCTYGGQTRYTVRCDKQN